MQILITCQYIPESVSFPVYQKFVDLRQQLNHHLVSKLAVLNLLLVIYPAIYPANQLYIV
jgi:hypothetical protein